MRIIRIENGDLMELSRTFIGLMTGVSIAVGSTILLASAAHLANVGTAGYAEDFASCARMLLKSFSNRVEIKHGVSILVGGCTGGRLVRSLAEVDAWLASLPENENFPAGARKASMLAVRNAGSGSHKMGEIRIRLPASLAGHDKNVWNSSGWSDLPETVEKINEVTVKEIIDTLISELKTVFSLNLDSDISLSRDQCSKRAADPHVPATIVVVGASNAGRLANLLIDGVIAHYIQVPSTRPNSVAIERAVEQLEKIEFPDPDRSLVVLFNLDCAAFFAVTEDGEVAPPKNIDGHYHLDGEMAIATKDMFQKTLKVCAPLLKLKPNIKKLVLSPLPRYWLEKCCNEESHVTNFGTEEYERNLFDGLSTLRRLTKDYLFLHHITNIKVINPFLVFADATGRTTSTEAIEAVRSIWGDDPVHPSLACLEKLSDYIINLANNNNGDTAAGPSNDRQPHPPKRLRWASEAPATFVSPIIRPQHHHSTPGRGWGNREFYGGGSRGRGGYGGSGYRGDGGRGGRGGRRGGWGSHKNF
jgi:uncharacterized membrane protein YgcG